MSYLALSATFEYLYFYSFSVGIDFRCHNMTSKVDPHVVRFKLNKDSSFTTRCELQQFHISMRSDKKYLCFRKMEEPVYLGRNKKITHLNLYFAATIHNSKH